MCRGEGEGMRDFETISWINILKLAKEALGHRMTYMQEQQMRYEKLDFEIVSACNKLMYQRAIEIDEINQRIKELEVNK